MAGKEAIQQFRENLRGELILPGKLVTMKHAKFTMV
jgi:hypothetical protein